MPIYEYRCPQCGTIFEQRRSFSQADDPTPCPACDNPKAERLLSRFMIATGGNGSAGAGVSKCSACARSSCAGCV